MLKRMSLVFTLLMALVGIVGVQAQAAADPQSMAQYLPADTEIFFSIRTDGAYFDELSDIVNGVVSKLPPALAAQAKSLDLRAMLEAEVGPLDETGVGDYLAVGASNTAVLYDDDRSNDDSVVFYAVFALANRDQFAALFEKAIPDAEKSEEDGVTIYRGPEGSEGQMILQDDVAYITNQQTAPTGDLLSESDSFTSTLGNLPEPSYNFVVYADLGPLFSSMMAMMPADSTAMMDTMGIDFNNVGPVALGGTVLDGKALVIDTYSPSFSSMMPMSGTLDSEFANNIPAGFSFVVHGTDLKSSANASLDLIYKMAEENSTNANDLPSRETINTQLKAVLGVDLDNDILGWMSGDYVLAADLDMMSVLDAMESGDEDAIKLDPRFALIIEGDGSEKPAKLAQVIGNLIVAQTKSTADAPKITLATEEGLTTVLIEGVPVSKDPEIVVNIELAGNGDFFLLGDQATVEAVLSGEGDRLPGDASYIDAQKYILPNANTVAYAGGEGWGDLVTLGGVALSAMSASPNNSANDQMAMIAGMLRSGYDIISSSSASVSYAEDGSQLSRLVLTLK